VKPFSTGQAAFNWARKMQADSVVVAVKDRRTYRIMTIVKVGDHYEGRWPVAAYLDSISNPLCSRAGRDA
jgi:hypothetical protein